LAALLCNGSKIFIVLMVKESAEILRCGGPWQALRGNPELVLKFPRCAGSG